MKKIIVLFCTLLGLGAALLRAGDVIPLSNTPTVEGTLTFADATNLQVVSVTSSNPQKFGLADVLEAHFGDLEFRLDYFSSAQIAGDILPPDWKGGDIGAVGEAGSFTYADGAFTVSGAGWEWVQKDDAYFFVGRPWTGDGQWTLHIRGVDPGARGSIVGLGMRETLDANSLMVGVQSSAIGNGQIVRRTTKGQGLQTEQPTPMDIPGWLRVTRIGNNFETSISSDGAAWDAIGEIQVESKAASPWVGFYVNGRRQQPNRPPPKRSLLGKATIDDVTFSPVPIPSEIYQPGVLLRDGSLLGGRFDSLSATEGILIHNKKRLSIPIDQIAAVIWDPVLREQIEANGAQTGVVMKNGDFLACDFQSIAWDGAHISSVLLGLAIYNGTSARACVLQTLQPQPSDYEVRLTDGSVLRAKNFGVSNDTQVTIEDLSGVDLDVPISEIAQVRAGLTRVQPLLDFPWKATPPAPMKPTANASNAISLGTNPPVVPIPPGPIPAPDPAVAAAAPLPPDPNDGVQVWLGNRQEHVLVLPAAMPVTFTLAGKFHAVAFSVALAPGTAPNTQTTIRVLADGREISRTPAFKAGDKPGFVEVTIRDAKTLTLEADSFYPGTKALLIDPVLILD